MEKCIKPAAAETGGNRSGITRRILLDLLMVLVLATLYSKNVISLMYHELIGLGIFVLFFCHLVFNRKWISRLFNGKRARNPKSVVMTVVNILLVLSWLAVLITGILISKKLFSFGASSLTPFHFFSAALALAVTGIHAGLHWQYIGSFLGKRVRLPKPVIMVLMAVILVFGCRQAVSSSFSRWITAPFISSASHLGDRSGGNSQAGTAGLSSPGHEMTASSDSFGQEMNASTPEGSGNMERNRSGNGQGPHGQQPFSLQRLLSVAATTFSIFFLFAALTRLVELLLRKKRPAMS